MAYKLRKEALEHGLKAGVSTGLPGLNRFERMQGAAKIIASRFKRSKDNCQP